MKKRLLWGRTQATTKSNVCVGVCEGGKYFIATWHVNQRRRQPVLKLKRDELLVLHHAITDALRAHAE